MNNSDIDNGIVYEGTATILSIHLLTLAKRILIKANRRQKIALNRGVECDVDDILEVYILLPAALESFINEFSLKKIELLKDAGESTYWSNSLGQMVDQKIEVKMNGD